MYTKSAMLYDASFIWSTARDVFPYFDELDFSWDERYYQVIHTILSENLSEDQFHMLMSNFVASLNDGHTCYYSPDYNSASSFKSALSYEYDPTNMSLTIVLTDFLHDYSSDIEKLIRSKYSFVDLVRIDIRNNSGGNSKNAEAVASLFIPHPVLTYRARFQNALAPQRAFLSRIKCSNKDDKSSQLDSDNISQPDIENAIQSQYSQLLVYKDITFCKHPTRHPFFNTHVEILIGPHTFSAAEDFAAMFKMSKRCSLIGQPTSGSTGDSYFIQKSDLKCGGSAKIVCVGYELADGTQFHNVGIQPNITVPK